MSEQYVLGPNEDDNLDELTDEVDGPVPLVAEDWYKAARERTIANLPEGVTPEEAAAELDRRAGKFPRPSAPGS